MPILVTSLTSNTEALTSKPPGPTRKELRTPRIVQLHEHDPKGKCLLQFRTPGAFLASSHHGPAPAIIFHRNTCNSLTTDLHLTFAPLKPILQQQLKQLQKLPITLRRKFEILITAHQTLHDLQLATSLAIFPVFSCP